MEFITHLLISAVLLIVVSFIVKGIEVKNFMSAGIAALVLGVVNAFIKPLVVLLTLPATLLSLGLFLFVINAFMLMLVSVVVPGFKVKGFGSALFGAVLLAVINLFVNSQMF